MRYSSRKLSNDKVITTACNFWRQIAWSFQVMSGNILLLGNKIFEIPPFFQTWPGDLGKKVHACSLCFSALKPQFGLKIREGRAPWAPFLDLPLNTYNPHCKSFRLEICDISRLFTHFSQLFPAVGSESHFFILLEVGKSVVCKSHESPWYLQKSHIFANSPLCPDREGTGGEGRGALHWLVHNRASIVLKC